MTDFVTANIRVTTIRFKGPLSTLMFGHVVDLNSGINDRTKNYAIEVTRSLCEAGCFDIGAIWKFSGATSTKEKLIDGFKYREERILAEEAELLKPSGHHVVDWLSNCVKGVGDVKAQKLWDKFGVQLYSILDEEDHVAVETVIRSEAIRNCLFEEWLKNGDANTLKFVQEKSIPLTLARKAIKFHKSETPSMITDDPYRLLSFSGEWRLVDTIAKERFGVPENDVRRYSAALEESLYRAFDHGHTCQSLADVSKRVKRLLNHPAQSANSIDGAMANGLKTGQFITTELDSGNRMLHPSGAWLMEKAVAEFVIGLLKGQARQASLFEEDVATIIKQFEEDERKSLGVPEFSLNAAQFEAVETSLNASISIITGGAGVGKTTVLKALYRALDTTGRRRFQMALSGRATARMAEATREPAETIASFLRNARPEDVGESPIVVIDEASMLDLVTFYRLTKKLPPGAQLILVGDPYQLPPVGAGLIFHLLCDIDSIPSTELTVVKRQAATSTIPVISKSIRDGVWPDFHSERSDNVVFIEVEDREILAKALSLYDLDKENTQVLCATKSCRFAGVEAINRACHSRYTAANKPLCFMNEYNGVIEQTGFCEGDLILFTKNDWVRDLQNGCLGRLVEVFDQPRQVNIGSADNPVLKNGIAIADFEGSLKYLVDSDIDDIEHSYAITVHKAQGSQFKRVIIPLRKSRILDRTFLYTALTRAQSQVILIGDMSAARGATEALPTAFLRKVGLGVMLESIGAQNG